LPSPCVTVSVCTRNRPDALLRCLHSLALAAPLIREAIVLDDGSTEPARERAQPALRTALPVRWLRNETGRGVAAGRNTVAREAASEWLLNLDDDAFLLDAEALRQAVAVLRADPTVGAIAFSQADGDGTPWPAAAQPAAADAPCVVAAFTGYGCLLRRDAFLAAGGFLEPMEINGEEKDLCLRLLDAGYRVVYLPGARVGHLAAATGRDPRRYLHQIVRNEVLSAAHSVPAPLWPALALSRLLRYFPMRRGWGIHDPGGLAVVVGVILRRLPGVLRRRRPVRWSTLRAWRALTAGPVPYSLPEPS
jgi:GT2 family glycosyltransferase